MKKYIAILFVALFAFACAGKQEAKAPEADATETTVEETVVVDSAAAVEVVDSAAMEVAE